MSAQHKPGALAIIVGIPASYAESEDNGIVCRLVKRIPKGTLNPALIETAYEGWELDQCSRPTALKTSGWWPTDLAAEIDLKVIGGPQIDITEPTTKDLGVTA